MTTIKITNPVTNENLPKRLRYSTLLNYPNCPKRFILSRKLQPRFKKKNENDMLKGSLFEYWATGGTSSPIVANMAEKWVTDKAYKIGKFQNETIEKVYKAAQSAKKAFVKTLFANHEFIIKLGKSEWELEFHPDVIGVVKLPDFPEPFAAITDTKYTASIQEVWGHKESKLDFLQAMVYIYGFYHYSKQNMEKAMLLPFVYQITEHNDFSNPIHKYVIIRADESDFIEFEHLLKTIMNDKEFKPKVNHFNCVGKGNQFGPCRYLDECPEGRVLINKTEVFNYGSLK